MTRLLLIEDERDLAEILQDNLEAEGYEVVWASDGHVGLQQWQSSPPDLVILDVMLPSMDGFALCRTMRERGDRTPVLFLSARGQPHDRVEGLAAGGDDYLVKPFHLPEFLMRIHTMLRRQQWHKQDDHTQLLSFAGHHIDLDKGKVDLADSRGFVLSADERRLLTLLATHEGEILERDQLLDALAVDGVYPATRTIERLFQQLRDHFEPHPEQPKHFHRMSGIRFQFTIIPKGEPS